MISLEHLICPLWFLISWILWKNGEWFPTRVSKVIEYIKFAVFKRFSARDKGSRACARLVFDPLMRPKRSFSSKTRGSYSFLMKTDLLSTNWKMFSSYIFPSPISPFYVFFVL